MRTPAEDKLIKKIQDLANTHYRKCNGCNLDFLSFYQGMVHRETMHYEKRCPACLSIYTSFGNAFKCHLTIEHFKIRNGQMDEHLRCVYCGDIRYYGTMWKHISDAHLAPALNIPPDVNPKLDTTRPQSSSFPLASHSNSTVVVKAEETCTDKISQTHRKFNKKELEIMIPLLIKDPNPPWEARATEIYKNYGMPCDRVCRWFSRNRRAFLVNEPSGYPSWALDHKRQSMYEVEVIGERMIIRNRKDGSGKDMNSRPSADERDKVKVPIYRPSATVSSNAKNYQQDSRHQNFSAHSPKREHRERYPRFINQRRSYPPYSRQIDIYYNRPANESNYRSRFASRYSDRGHHSPNIRTKYELSHRRRSNFGEHRRSDTARIKIEQEYPDKQRKYQSLAQEVPKKIEKPIDGPSGSCNESSSSGKLTDWQKRQAKISSLRSDDLKFQFIEVESYFEKLLKYFQSHRESKQQKLVDVTELAGQLVRKQKAFQDYQRQKIDENLDYNEKVGRNQYINGKNFKNDIARPWAPILIYATYFKIPVYEAVKDFMEANRMETINKYTF